MSENPTILKKQKENIDKEDLTDVNPKVKRMVEQSFTMMTQSGGLPPEIASKVTPQHIDKVLDNTSKVNEYIYNERSTDKKHNLFYFSLLIGLVVFIIIWMRTNPELLKTVLTILFSAGGGFGAGWGFARYKEN